MNICFHAFFCGFLFLITLASSDAYKSAVQQFALYTSQRWYYID